MIRLDAIAKQHGKQILFMEASAAINRGEKVGLVGPNGSGKTTIFRMIVKEEQPDGGQVTVDRGTTIGYFSQDVGEMRGRTVVAETMAGAGAVSDALGQLGELEHALADPDRLNEMDVLVERFGHAQARFEELGGYALEAKARAILAGLGFSEDVMDGDVGALSGGWKVRVELAKILLMRPDALLLDEPTNHLDLESILWLEGFLRDYAGAIVMTSHDREFMNRLVTKIVEIDGGDITTYAGDYDSYEKQRDVAALQAEAAYARQQAMLAKEQRFIERFKTHAAKAAQVQSRVKKLDKIDKVELPPRRQTIAFDFRAPPRSGEDVANLAAVTKGYGARVVYDGLDLLIRRRERWCVMGENGAGKSTLLRLIAGTASPDTGSVVIGASVKMGYFAQHAMDQLDATLTVWDTLIGEYPKASIGSLRTIAGCFGFSGDDIEKPVRVLSGGEKARLVLARMLFDPPNFLVLDEPTNHLDLATKEMLVGALAAFEGTMIFVSHDRRFLAALSNRVLEITPSVPSRAGSLPPVSTRSEAVSPRAGVKAVRTTAYGGGYIEYVASTGREAPGLRT